MIQHLKVENAIGRDFFMFSTKNKGRMSRVGGGLTWCRWKAHTFTFTFVIVVHWSNVDISNGFRKNHTA